MPEAKCELIGELGGFGWWVQGFLAILSFSFLFYKRWREKPRRSWKVFFFDSSKQLLGSGAMHILNLLFASIWETSMDGDACNWYWINIMLDTTIGVIVLYYLLSMSKRLLKLTGEKTYGYYGDPPRLNKWMQQASLWIILELSMKATMVLLMFIFFTPLKSISEFLLTDLDPLPRVKLIVVMILTPVIMNGIQYWMIDNFIKDSPKSNSRVEMYTIVTPPPLSCRQITGIP